VQTAPPPPQVLRAEGLEQEAFSFSRLAALLHTLPIGRGRDRYLRVLERDLASREHKESAASTEDDLDDSAGPVRRRTERAAGLRLLRELIQGLFANLPDQGQSQNLKLESAARCGDLLEREKANRAWPPAICEQSSASRNRPGLVRRLLYPGVL